MGKKHFLLIIYALAPILLMAQPGGGDPGGDPDVPITGIEILIGLGGALGAKYFVSRKKRSRH